jgi:ectoine hydroxylase
LRRQEYGVPDPEILARLAAEGGIESPTGPAGSALFFDCNLLHGSNSNITPFPRSNAFFVYNAVENRLAEPFGGIPPRPEFIAARDFIEPIPPMPE